MLGSAVRVDGCDGVRSGAHRPADRVAGGRPGTRKTMIECKLLRGSLERTLRDVLEWTFQVRE